MTQFLIDASMPRLTSDVIRRHGHDAVDVRDIGHGNAVDAVIAQEARTGALALIARDDDFADVRIYPPAQYAGIVIIRAPKNAKRDLVLRMGDGFLTQLPALMPLTGRLFLPGSTRNSLPVKGISAGN